ncbi:hypothetical protein AB0B20_27980, partial [Micromonospora sp. NPDC049151]
LRWPRGLRYEVLAWSQNQIPETSSVVDHRHTVTSTLPARLTKHALDLLPDGSTAGWDKDPAGGVIPRGSVLSFWRANSYRASVHPATLCLRRNLVFALGGWMALPASEDTGLLLAASAVSEGYFTREYGLLYRKWPGQVTSQAAHRDPAEFEARMGIIQARANVLASMIPNGLPLVPPA